MTVTRRVLMAVGLLGAILLAGVPGIAQEKPADNMQLVLEKIRADKKLLVAENLQLTEAEAKAFWPVYSKYQDELFLLRGRTAKLITDYAAAYDQMSNATAKKLLDESLTIEALGKAETLHPIQEAFLAEGASQCGYCTPGMIMTVAGLLREKPKPTEAEILSRMQGHLCRCCNYPKILKAVRRAVAQTNR